MISENILKAQIRKISIKLSMQVELVTNELLIASCEEQVKIMMRALTQ